MHSMAKGLLLMDAAKIAKRRLNGWQRLWIVATVIWLPVACYFVWNTFPEEPKEGVCFPFESTSDHTAEVVRAAVKELKRKGILASITESRTVTHEEYSLDALLSNGSGYASVCDAVIDQLKKSEQAESLHDAGIRLRFQKLAVGFVFSIILWLGPAAAIYALGLAVAWVRRGFVANKNVR